MSQALARKWRPKTFTELVGQDHVVKALTNALVQGRVHHAWLFTGTRGVGKTTLARIIAKALNCASLNGSDPCGVCDSCQSIDRGRFVDVIELDAASNTQVDNMRDLLETAAYAPTAGQFKIFIIDEVHMLSRSAFNAMLKTLEEPPEHVKFILATTDPQKVPVTVLSRCLQFNLKPIPEPIIDQQIQKILGFEELKFESHAIQLVARYAKGSMRDALSLLDQAIAQGGGSVTTDSVKTMLGVVDGSVINELLEHVIDKNPQELTTVVNQLMSIGASFSSVLDEMAMVLQNLSLFQMAPQAVRDAEALNLESLSSHVDAEHVQLLYQIATIGRRDLSLAPDERTGFMMVMLRMIAFLPGDNTTTAVIQPRKSPAKKAITPKADRTRPESVASTAKASQSTTRSISDNDEWKNFVLDRVKTGMAKMLAENSEFVGFSDGVLNLMIAENQKHLLQEKYREKLQEIVRSHVDPQCRLDIKLGGSGDTRHADHVVEEKALIKKTTEDIEDDPFVKSLKEDFGGTVVSDSIKPNK
jgi:DNA polymerase-3 subunit gamma/tau